MQSTNGGGSSDHSHHHYQQQQQWLPPPHSPYHHPSQQWMMHPAAAAMAAMNQQQMMMMYPQHYAPYFNYARNYQQQPPPYQFRVERRDAPSQQKSGSVKEEDVKTIWIGDLKPWMDESYLQSCFSSAGELISVKVIRNKQTGQPDGFGFVEFSSRGDAEKVIQSYPGTSMPNSDQPFRLNWATFSPAERRSDPGSDLSIFVGDLAPDVTDTILQETFASKYQSIQGVKVVVDPNTGSSKGYGFIKFGDESEKSRALTEMNGTLCLNRPMRIGVATPRRSPGYQHRSSLDSGTSGENGFNSMTSQGFQSDSDTNRTIFVGGVDSETTEEEIRKPFSMFGEVVSVKIPVGKGCAFVNFAERSDAENAMDGLNGTVIGKQTVRLAWGRPPTNKWRNNYQQHWNGPMNWGQSHRGYGNSTPQGQDHTTAAATVNAKNVKQTTVELENLRVS